MAISDPSHVPIEPNPDPRAATHLSVQDSVAGGWHVLRLAGEMDLVSTTVLDAALEHIDMASINGVELDLSKVEFIDSTGVRAIVEFNARCRERDTAFRIVPGSVAVQRIFEITGLVDVLPFAGEAEPA